MKAILIALIFMCGLAVFTFGGSIPTSYQQFKNGSYTLEFRPMIDLGGMYRAVNERKIPMP